MTRHPSERLSLGIELGSTRIKAVLIDGQAQTLATGSHAWENRLEAGYWTYDLQDAWRGIQDCIAQVATQVQAATGHPLTTLDAIGVSAMMHGYLAFAADGTQLVPFRTWRNNTTAQSAAALSDALSFNVPQRFSVAHLYQAMLDDEAHLPRLAFLTTLAGYIHWQLSGKKVLGAGDASGMFPLDAAGRAYDPARLAQFDALAAAAGYPVSLRALLPTPLPAGSAAGRLTDHGAQLLDPTGTLRSGALMAPPEGDAGTGMVATNSVRPGTGNVSVGTSAFSMIVLNRPLHTVQPDIDCVTTPAGAPVAMVHANNCTSDLNAWFGLFGELAEALGAPQAADALYGRLLSLTAAADADAGGLVNYANLSGENITAVAAGRPSAVRTPDAHFTLANFIQSQLFAAFAPLKIGSDRLVQAEGIRATRLVAQGGLFRTPKIAQQVLADALATPITVMQNAGEGGPWGAAVLAAFALDSHGFDNLGDYLDRVIFAGASGTTLAPTAAGTAGFDRYIAQYQRGLPAIRLAGADLPLHAAWS
ncbi:xylulokinase [Lacticaseibacillus kribbianus]|uniref:xylulokinase n=1 Tax=Lacticaseibacillus kribbianus TaxID=2926292 RepID=UPI001CD51AA1|nr:FGGY-family carbohydrate kinase [Lacticaseibacillus kribbianus]